MMHLLRLHHENAIRIYHALLGHFSWNLGTLFKEAQDKPHTERPPVTVKVRAQLRSQPTARTDWIKWVKTPPPPGNSNSPSYWETPVFESEDPDLKEHQRMLHPVWIPDPQNLWIWEDSYFMPLSLGLVCYHSSWNHIGKSPTSKTLDVTIFPGYFYAFHYF